VKEKKLMGNKGYRFIGFDNYTGIKQIREGFMKLNE